MVNRSNPAPGKWAGIYQSPEQVVEEALRVLAQRRRASAFPALSTSSAFSAQRLIPRKIVPRLVREVIEGVINNTTKEQVYGYSKNHLRAPQLLSFLSPFLGLLLVLSATAGLGRRTNPMHHDHSGHEGMSMAMDEPAQMDAAQQSKILGRQERK